MKWFNTLTNEHYKALWQNSHEMSEDLINLTQNKKNNLKVQPSFEFVFQSNQEQVKEDNGNSYVIHYEMYTRYYFIQRGTTKMSADEMRYISKEEIYDLNLFDDKILKDLEIIFENNKKFRF